MARSAAAVSFLGVGDIYLSERNGPTPFGAVEQLLAQHDLRFCSHEGVVTSRREPLRDGTNTRSDPGVLEILSRSAFDLVSLAHNHALDFGPEALCATVAQHQAAGIAAAGAGENEGHARAPALVERRGLRIGLLAYCSILAPGTAARERRAGVAPLRALTTYQPDFALAAENPGWPPRVLTSADPDDLCQLERDVRALRPQVDVLLVSCHWGLFGKHDLLAYQQEAGRAAVDAGADLVLGHHAHVIQGVERYKERCICYGLGHFAFGRHNPNFGGLTLAVQAGLIVGGVVDVRITPLGIDGQGNPVLLPSAGVEQASELLTRLSSGLNVQFRHAGGDLWVE